MDVKADAIVEAVERTLSTRKKKSISDQSLMPAAVLILLYSNNGEYCILLNKRAQEVGYHKGEISFPGGGRDPSDGSFSDTALRETHEEMGINPGDVRLLGELDEVATRSQFGVRVLVGTIPYPYPFKPSPVEIAEVLEVPIRDLLGPANHREEVRWVGGKGIKSYSYAYGDHLIFGATAQIVTQFVGLLEDWQGSKEGTAD